MSTMPPPAEVALAERDAFYHEFLELLLRSGIPFLLAGTHAINAHTGMDRPAGDLDVFCTPADRPRILEHFRRLGYETETTDRRWLGKVRRGDHFVDVISNSSGGVAPVTEGWFTEEQSIRAYGVEVPLLAATELVWSKLFVQDRYRYDGADVAHVILRQSASIDWRRLVDYAERHWEVLLAHLLNFRFVYPTERERVPGWVLEELTRRLREGEPPVPRMRVCRGRIFSPGDYVIDVTKWGFVDVHEVEEE